MKNFVSLSTRDLDKRSLSKVFCSISIVLEGQSFELHKIWILINDHHDIGI